MCYYYQYKGLFCYHLDSVEQGRNMNIWFCNQILWSYHWPYCCQFLLLSVKTYCRNKIVYQSALFSTNSSSLASCLRHNAFLFWNRKGFPVNEQVKKPIQGIREDWLSDAHIPAVWKKEHTKRSHKGQVLVLRLLPQTMGKAASWFCQPEDMSQLASRVLSDHSLWHLTLPGLITKPAVEMNCSKRTNL